MRRRLDLGASLVARPKVLLLDEPTTGLDPLSRSELWDFIRDLVDALGVMDSAVLARRYLLRYVRVPAFMVFSAIQPVMFVLLFRYVFGGAIRVPNGSYVDFLLPGIISVAFGVAICTIAAVIGLSIRDPETVQSAGLIWLFPLTFASAAFVDAGMAAGVCQGQSGDGDLQRAARPRAGRSDHGAFLPSVAWIAAIALVFVPLAARAYRRAV